VKNNREKAAELIVKHKILENKSVAYNSIPRCNLNFKTASDTRELIDKYLQIFYDMNPDIVGGKLPDEDFYYQK
jgi:NitT/TauT family transport system substrate-binding protein